MRRIKFALIKTTCRRCGKELYTGNRSLYGLDQAKAELDRICKDCITADEHSKILRLEPIINKS
jgi:RNase P subunit RPR2